MSQSSLLIFHHVYKHVDENVCMFASPCYDLYGFVRKVLPTMYALRSKGVEVQFVYNYSYFTCSKGHKTFVIEHSDNKYTTPMLFSQFIQFTKSS